MTDVLTVSTADGTTHDITITIDGAEDAPVIGGVDTGSVPRTWIRTPTVCLETTGALTVTDVDAGEDQFVAETVAGTTGA